MEQRIFDERFLKTDSLFEKKEDSHSCVISTDLVDRPHMHPEIEIIICINGKAEAYIDNRMYEFKAGDISIVFPNQIHFYKIREEGEFLVLIFVPSIMPNIEEEFFNYIIRNPIISYSQNISLTDTIYELKKRYLVDRNQSNILLTGYINIIMHYLLGYIKVLPVSNEKSGIVKQICDYCMIHYDSDIKLEVLANELHMSTFRISHIFNEQMNMSIPTYVNMLRVSKACKMLAKEDESISFISGAVGFSSFRSFNRAFLKIMGETPSEYKKKYYKKQNQ